MKYVNMQGTKVPSLGFGTWQLTGASCVASTRKALEIGYRHIDTAQIYENEAEVGKALKESSVAREELFVTTKLWTSNFTAPRVQASAEESLKKLGLDYVDLLLIHWHNPDVPLKETLGAMQKLVEQGKVKQIGVSNFTVALMKEAQQFAKIACNQVEYHVLLSQRAVLEQARKSDMMVTAYSPLARGKLTENSALQQIAKKHGKTPGQVALRWLVEQENVSAIPKAASEKNARSNFEIFDFVLDADDQKAIWSLNGNGRTINPGWAPEWDAA